MCQYLTGTVCSLRSDKKRGTAEPRYERIDEANPAFGTAASKDVSHALRQTSFLKTLWETFGPREPTAATVKIMLPLCLLNVYVHIHRFMLLLSLVREASVLSGEQLC